MSLRGLKSGSPQKLCFYGVKIPFKNKNPPCPYFEVVGKGSLRGAKPLYRNYLPLVKGKGIKGIGLLKEELKGGEVGKHLSLPSYSDYGIF